MNYQKMLKLLRRRMFVSQVELAKIIGVSFASVNRWENGHYEPRNKTKKKLNQLFNKENIKEN